jgi:tetratricopeptide (TPR) repeat protein
MRYKIHRTKFYYHRVSASGIILTFLLFFCVLPNFCFAETETVSQLSEQEIRSIYDKCWQLLTRIHIDKPGLDKAIELYEKVLAVAPHHRDIHWKLSESTFKKAEAMGNDAKSLVVYKKALNYAKIARKAYPDSIEAHFWVGCCSARIAEIIYGILALPIINEAKTELKLTIELNPDHRFAILAATILAQIYTDAPWPLSNLKKAEQYAKEAVRKDPNLAYASVTLARVFIKQKKKTRAREEAVRCLTILEPTYIWDAELYNRPDARRLLSEIDNHQ